ncbi:MAG: hypothetical protein ACRDBQ_14265, partial [Shewanella sp.]
ARQQFYEISYIQQTYATNRWLDRLLGYKGDIDCFLTRRAHWALEDVLERAGNQGGVIDAVRRKGLKLIPKEGRTDGRK